MLDEAMRPVRPMSGSALAAVARDLSWRRFALAGGVAVVVSTQVLFQPGLFELWSPADIALAVGRYALELLFIAVLQVVAFTLVDHLAVAARAVRALVFVLVQASVSFASVVTVGVVEALPAFDRPRVGMALAESLRWSLLACFVGAVFLVHRRAVATRRLAVALEEASEALQREQLGMQLQLLQAQIEPHFLFNTLANMRRLYRIQPEAAVQMVESLLRYLRAALPQARAGVATVGDELELVRAYLDLVRIRMGPRLQYRIGAEAELHALPLPSMLVITLVENAVKHGLEQLPRGGTVEVDARRVDAWLEITVQDDGVGLGGTGAGGNGVGLVNIRRQLALRFGSAGSLAINARRPRGVVCTLRLPLPRTGNTGPITKPSVAATALA